MGRVFPSPLPPPETSRPSLKHTTGTPSHSPVQHTFTRFGAVAAPFSRADDPQAHQVGRVVRAIHGPGRRCVDHHVEQNIGAGHDVTYDSGGHHWGWLLCVPFNPVLCSVEDQSKVEAGNGREASETVVAAWAGSLQSLLPPHSGAPTAIEPSAPWLEQNPARRNHGC